MRIVLVNKYTRVTGGADRHCLDLADLLRERGHQIRFMSFVGERDPRIAGSFVTPTVTHETRDRMSAPQRLVAATTSLWNRTAAAAMRRLIAEFQPDIVHAHKLYPQLSVAPVFVANSAGVPVVQTAHDYEFIAAHSEDESGRRIDRRESTPSYRALNTATFPVRRCVHAPRVTRWIAISQFVATAYERHGISCEVIKHFAREADEQSPPFEARRGVLFSGRLTESKGVRDLLELAGRVPRLEVTIAGRGPLLPEVESAVKSCKNVGFAGFVDRITLRHLVSKSRVVVIPSRWAEPAGLAALESMVVGTPVVAYATGGLTEYVSDARAGLLVQPGVESLAGALLRVHDDPDLWHRLSRAALEAVTHRHTPKRYVERLEGVYRRAATVRGRPARGVLRSPALDCARRR